MLKPHTERCKRRGRQFDCMEVRNDDLLNSYYGPAILKKRTQLKYQEISDLISFQGVHSKIEFAQTKKTNSRQDTSSKTPIVPELRLKQSEPTDGLIKKKLFDQNFSLLTDLQ